MKNRSFEQDKIQKLEFCGTLIQRTRMQGAGLPKARKNRKSKPKDENCGKKGEIRASATVKLDDRGGGGWGPVRVNDGMGRGGRSAIDFFQAPASLKAANNREMHIPR
ncbi:hypothetical protein GWI33_005337 [Rhynchophorus ferrugineus]|uniref:Uncharacterized protein n=1 Tax=Rhynchophorus ferrugineus TaxID=354439 RepID=A0A834IWD7_RHYFE|nr:hypothetical protein GWI33_005337 [Rhynchophorus ferrugineus]